MPRAKGPERAIPDPVERGMWAWGDSAASAGSCGEWDVKEGDLAVAILSVLASGCAIRFGTTSDGGAVSVTIYDGQKLPTRKYVADSISFDDLMSELIQVAKRLHVGRFGPGVYANGNGAESR